MGKFKDFLDNITAFVKGNIQHIITLSFIGCFLYQVMTGQKIEDALWQPVAVILTFWFGETAVSKIGTYIKAALLTDPKTGTIGNGNAEPPKADGGDNGSTQPVPPPKPAPPPVETIEPKPFDKPAFLKAVETGARKLFGLTETDTVTSGNLYSRATSEIADLKWESNNTLASLDKAQTMAQLAAKWLCQVLEIPEIITDPITYVSEHIMDFRKKCGSCKTPDNLLTVEQVIEAFSTEARFAYNELIAWQNAVADLATTIQQKGNQVWKT